MQEDKPFAIEDLIADVISREGDEAGDDASAEDEVGPSDEGELADDDLFAADDDEDQEESSDSDEDGEEDPDSEDEELADDETPDPEGEPEAEAKVDPRDEEIDNLKALVLQTQQQSQQLIDFVLTQQEAQRKSQTTVAPKVHDLSEEDAHTALFSGDPKAFDGRDPALRDKAVKFAQNWTKDQARYARDPSLFYRERLREFILADVQQMVGPVVQQHTVSQAQTVINRHMGDLDPAAQKRAAEVFQGLNSPTEAALKFSVDFVRKELAEQKLAERERKVETSERQKKANRAAARRGKTGTRRPPKTKNKQPRWNPGEDLAEYAERLQQ